jgi:hypothetical protein
MVREYAIFRVREDFAEMVGRYEEHERSAAQQGFSRD